MKKKMFTKALGLLLAACMLTACGSTEGAAPEQSAAEPAAEKTVAEVAAEPVAEDVFKDVPEKIEAGCNIVATPEMYSNIDLSKEETIYIYLIGSTPNDMDQITELANEYLKPFNTNIEFTIMAWSDYQDLYSLNLTSGTNIDAIFTAPWCYLWTEASKGSFLTLTDDFISSYMPLTDRLQIPESWGGVKLNGNIVAIPQNTTNPNGKMVAIRQDLADKYGIGELTSWEDYKNFCLTIAEKETPQSGILAMAAAGSNPELWDVYRQQFDTMPAMTDGTIVYYYKYNGKIPTYDEIEFAYTTDYFLSFCKDMQEMANAGVWSRSALTNEISAADSFGALASASMAWNTSVFQGIETCEKNEGVVGAAYDITQKNFAIGEAYNNNDIAITASSVHPERTAMVLDIIKNDTYLNHLFRLGVEGTHYSIDENGVYTELDKSEDYPADSLSLCWAVKNGDITQGGADPRKQAITDAETAKMVACPTEGFVFDDTPVAFEVSAVNTVLDEYVKSLQLGLLEDIEGSIATMMEQANEAGLEKVEAEFKSQYEAWYATMQ
ncbi:MAG: ABC transporter substrate-binding protein [Lachnospiraceae bacterium]|nr:ABC transporter substrate-binding protein [Lachnospiraceae bacterium]